METFDFVGTINCTRMKKRSRDANETRTSKSEGTLDKEKKAKEDEEASRTTVLRDITNRRKVPAEDELKTRPWGPLRRRNEVARERWNMLAKALLKPKKPSFRSSKMKDFSVRRFSSFDLITPIKLDKIDNIEGFWMRYTTKISNIVYQTDIHHLEPKLTPEELMGFNNTGNICIWPSEEVLAFYVLSHIQLFEGKEILEVGGGMTCLAGLMLSKYGAVKRADLTDGNPVSVKNVREILRRNNMASASAFQLDWTDHRRLSHKYDIVLSSDCLFFDETRSDLADTIWNCLKDDGIALVVAPRRGNTLDSFLEIATRRGFYLSLRSRYNEVVWKHHLEFKKTNPDYDDDLHYPLLLLLTKSERRFPVSHLGD